MQRNDYKSLHCMGSGSRTHKPSFITASQHFPFYTPILISSFFFATSFLCPILFDRVFSVQNTGKRKRGERNDPLWFMPNNTCFSVSLFVYFCVSVCVCPSLCLSMYSGQLLRSRYPSQLHPAE